MQFKYITFKDGHRFLLNTGGVIYPNWSVLPNEYNSYYTSQELYGTMQYYNLPNAIIGYVKDGLPVKEACILTFGITDRTFRNWEKWAIEDIEAGFTADESNLIKLMVGLLKEDLNLHRKLTKKAFEIALYDNDTKMIHFLLKTRYNYSEKTKHEIEANSDTAPVTFNIVPMKPIDEGEDENNY